MPWRLIIFLSLAIGMGGGGKDDITGIGNTLALNVVLSTVTNKVLNGFVLPEVTWGIESPLSYARVFGAAGLLCAGLALGSNAGIGIIYLLTMRRAIESVIARTHELLHVDYFWGVGLLLLLTLMARVNHLGCTLVFLLAEMCTSYTTFAFTKSLERVMGDHEGKQLLGLAGVLIGAPLALVSYFYTSLAFSAMNERELKAFFKGARFEALKWLVGMSVTRTQFEVLGVSERASKQEVKKAFRELSRQVHPDKNPDPAAHARFHKLQRAYQSIVDGGAEDRYAVHMDELAQLRGRIAALAGFYLWDYGIQVVMFLAKLIGFYRSLKKRKPRGNFGVSDFPAALSRAKGHGFFRFLTFLAWAEVYATKAADSPSHVRTAVSKWEHVLKQAVAHRAMCYFEHPVKIEQCMQVLKRIKGTVFESLDEWAAEDRSEGEADEGEGDERQGGGEDREDRKKRNGLEFAVVDHIRFVMYYRVMSLVRMKRLGEIYLEAHFRGSEAEKTSLQRVVDSVDELIKVAKADYKSFNEDTKGVADPVKLEDDELRKSIHNEEPAIRKHFWRAFRSSDALVWVTKALQANWYEVDFTFLAEQESACC